MTRPGFVYDQSRCIGCNACQMACKDKNNLEVGVFCRRADTFETESNGQGKWVHFSGSCNHCEKPACVGVCPTGAMQITAEHLVVVDAELCIGCGACTKACPYGAVCVSERTHRAIKCDGCRDLLAKGQKPACVDACLTHCLDFVDLDEISPATKEAYVDTLPFLPDASLTKPSLLIQPKTNFPQMPKGQENSCSASTSLKENRFFVNPPRERSSRNLVCNPVRNPAENAGAFNTNGSDGFSSSIEKLLSLTSFFKGSREAYQVYEKETLNSPSPLSSETFSLSYDYLFCGTDADCLLPIWASVALGEKVLLNQTTLAVIQFYHRYGYAPVRIGGNPPDYIGEQFRFLTYLTAALSSERNSLMPSASATSADSYGRNCRAAICEFIKQYTLPTLDAICKELSPKDAVQEWILAYLHHGRKFLTDYAEAVSNMPVPVSAHFSTYPGLADIFHTDTEICQLSPPIPDQDPELIHTAGLNNCGGICVICPKLQEGCMLSITSDQSKNAPQLRACVRGRGYRKTFLHPGRLRYPMKRVGERGSGKFQRISWEEATSLLASEWIRIRDTYGPGSRYIMYGTGVEGIMRPSRLMKRLLSLDGGVLDFFNSYSSACVNYMDQYLYGTVNSGHSAADLLNTRLLILWADNTAESIFGPERNYYLSELKKKGVKIICIDPRLSQTGVTYADEWYAIRPSTDAALADAMAYVIWSEGLQDQNFMDKYCVGFDEDHLPEGVPAGESYHSYLFGSQDGIAKTPEWAEAITGIEADRIRHLARLYATTKPAHLACGLGAQRHGNGEQTARATAMLACLTGNIGISGGGGGGNESCFAEHADIDLFTDHVENPYKGVIPTFLWTKAIEHGTELTPRKDRIKGMERLDSNIKMIFCLASDVLINQHSNINDTIRILKDRSKCEFIVCSDIFMTPSARYADLILPAPSVFEIENIVHSWAGANYLLKNNPVLEPLFDCRFEWDWMKELARILGLYDAFIDGKPEVSDWLMENYEILRTKESGLPSYEQFSAEGGWQFRDPICTVGFEQEIADPEHHPFPTPSGKIEIFSKELYEFGQLADIPAIPKYIPCPEGPSDQLRKTYPLQLIGWHTRRRCHSIHDNNEWQDEVEMPGLWIHPEDAAARQIRDKDLVEVFNDRGRVQIPAVVTDRICKGVCAMAQGAWYTPDKDGRDTRGSINVLTSSRPTPLAKGNPQHTNLVEVLLLPQVKE